MGCLSWLVLHISLASIPLVYCGEATTGLQKTGRALPLAVQQTKLEYGPSPVDFLASKGYEYNQNRDTPGNLNSNRPSSVITPKGVNNFSPALPYDSLPPKQTAVASGSKRDSATGSRIPYPSVSLYNTQPNKPNTPGLNNVLTRPAYPGAQLQNTNQVPGRQDFTPQIRHPQQPVRTINTPNRSNLQGKLNFNLFQNQDFGGNSPYFQSSPFVRNSQGSFFGQQRPFHDLGVNSRGQPSSSNSYNKDGFSGFRPILSQGFSVPTTYNGDKRTSLLSDEAFSSVTDPSMDKRTVIGSYVPSNNFVNPSNFLIPTEDKYSMVDRIFGGFEKPFTQSNQNQNKKNLNNSPTAQSPESYYNSNSHDRNSNIRQNPSQFGQNLFYGDQNPAVKNGKKAVVGAAQHSGKRGSNLSQSKSITVPGYDQGFRDDGLFSNSPNIGYNTNSNPAGGQDPPTLLFSDFSYNKPLSLNQFRSKNLLGDNNFGQTEYDKTRLSSDTLLNNDNFNARQDYSPSSGRQGTASVFGNNGFKQVGGATATAGNAYDNSYQSNRGYDKTFDDDSKTSRRNDDTTSKQGFSDNYSQNDAYNNADAYSDDDGYNQSFRFSDGGSESDYNAKDDANERGYQNSYQNSDDKSDLKTYNNADGYNRAVYNGNNYDRTDGYTDNVNYDNSDSDVNRQQHDSEAGYRQGVADVAAVLANQKPVQPYRGLAKAVTNNLPKQASYKPFDVNGDVTN